MKFVKLAEKEIIFGVVNFEAIDEVVYLNSPKIYRFIIEWLKKKGLENKNMVKNRNLNKTTFFGI